MVKNTTGGKGSKSIARKNEVSHYSGKLRLAEETDELYALIIKSLGNCMFHVKTIDGQLLLMHIRGKFSGRNKRNNFITVGSFVLIGLRDFEKPNYKNCDLLEIYSSQDVNRLMSVPSIKNTKFFVESVSASSSSSLATVSEDVDIIFSDYTAPVASSSSSSSESVEKYQMEEEINIDEI
jgi:initiation factor 1A